MIESKKEEFKLIKKNIIKAIEKDKFIFKKKTSIDNMFFHNKKKGIYLEDEFKENSNNKYKNYKILDLKVLKRFLSEIKIFLFGATLKSSNYSESNAKEISKQIRLPIKFGFFILIITLVFFSGWSIFAPLDSASIAEGHIILSSYKKEILHEGGNIVDEILVQDGDQVKKDQPLIVLNKYKAKAQLDNDLWQLRYTILSDKRLSQCLKVIPFYQSANIVNISNVKVEFNNKYLDNSDKKVFKLIEAQKNSYESFKSYIANSIKSFVTQIDQIQSEIKSLNERIKFYKENIIILEKEFHRKKDLHAKKLETIEKLTFSKLDLQRYKGQVLEDEAKIILYKHKITEINAKKANFLDEQNIRLSEEYKKNHTELLRLEAIYISSKDNYKRTTIVAPNSGIISGLNIHTTGSILRHDNRAILEIIPQDDNLVIEAHIATHEIDSINLGNKAKIQLNAYKSRIVPRIEGKVFYAVAIRTPTR